MKLVLQIKLHLFAKLVTSFPCGGLFRLLTSILVLGLLYRAQLFKASLA